MISIFKKCPYYRDSETLARGNGLGHCDLGGETICEADVLFCDKPDVLKKQLAQSVSPGQEFPLFAD